VAFRGRETLLVTSGLAEGEQVILTDLPAAMEGMALRTPDDPLAPTPGAGAGNEAGGPGRGAARGTNPAGGGGNRP
jgi:hypothetical protein